jgi:hypothetical protein
MGVHVGLKIGANAPRRLGGQPTNVRAFVDVERVPQRE